MFDLDAIMRAFWRRPIYQRLFLAFTVGLFLSCAARVAGNDVSTQDVSAQVQPLAHVAQAGQ